MRLSGARRAGEDVPGTWVKSSLSVYNGNCVEVASLSGGAVGMRHSKDPTSVILHFAPKEWDAFIVGVRNGEFNFRL